MKWIKKGLIYTASGKVPWSKNYAGIPTAGLIDEEKESTSGHQLLDRLWMNDLLSMCHQC